MTQLILFCFAYWSEIRWEAELLVKVVTKVNSIEARPGGHLLQYLIVQRWQTMRQQCC